MPYDPQDGETERSDHPCEVGNLLAPGVEDVLRVVRAASSYRHDQREEERLRVANVEAVLVGLVYCLH